MQGKLLIRDKRSRDSRGRRDHFGGPDVAFLILSACALLAIMIALQAWANTGQVYRGVEVGKLSLGGMTPEEAEEAVADRAERTREGLRLAGPDGTAVSGESLDFGYDAAATAREAYAVGRRGNVVERLRDRLRAVLGGVEVAPVVDREPGALRSAVERLTREAKVEPRDASVAISDGRVEVAGAREGREMDAAATVRSVEQAVKTMSGEAEVIGRKLEPRISTPEAEAAARKARTALSGPVVLAAGEQEWTLSPAEVGHVLSVVPEGEALKVDLEREHLRTTLTDIYDALEVEPICGAFPIAGSALLVTALAGYSLSEAVGAFLVSGILVALIGVSGLFDAIMSRVPNEVIMGALAGILFKFGTEVFAFLPQQPLLVGAMVGVYLVSFRLVRRLPPVLPALAVGLIVAGLTTRNKTRWWVA